jgi:hypothetical protein
MGETHADETRGLFGLEAEKERVPDHVRGLGRFDALHGDLQRAHRESAFRGSEHAREEEVAQEAQPLLAGLRGEALH